jgi:hypothetical protein
MRPAPIVAFFFAALAPVVAHADDAKALAFTKVAGSDQGTPLDGPGSKPGWAILDNDDNFAMWLAMRGVTTNPAYDDATEEAVAVYLGQKPTHGFSVTVTKVERLADTVRVSWVESDPLPFRYIEDKTPSYPWTVVKFPKQMDLRYNQVTFVKVDPPSTKIPFTVIAQSSGADGPSSAGAGILDTDLNWGMFWMTFGTQQPPASPTYDYRSELAVDLTVGSEPTGGYAMNVKDVSLVAPVDSNTPWSVVVTYVRTSPADPATAPAGVTNAFEVVKFSRQLPDGSLLESSNVVLVRLDDRTGKVVQSGPIVGTIKRSGRDVTITDSSGKTYSLEKGNLTDLLACQDGKSVKIRADVAGNSARVLSVTAVNGSATVTVKDAKGNELKDVGAGEAIRTGASSRSGTSPRARSRRARSPSGAIPRPRSASRVR